MHNISLFTAMTHVQISNAVLCHKNRSLQKKSTNSVMPKNDGSAKKLLFCNLTKIAIFSALFFLQNKLKLPNF